MDDNIPGIVVDSLAVTLANRESLARKTARDNIIKYAENSTSSKITSNTSSLGSRIH
jgi:hypothetical protein